MNLVWKHSKHAGTGRLLLLALADYADDDGNNIYPSVGALATKCRTSPRNVNHLLLALQASGELVIRQNDGPRGTNRYLLCLQPDTALKQASAPEAHFTPEGGFTSEAHFILKSASPTPEAGVLKPLKQPSPEPSLNHQEPSVPAKAPRKASKRPEGDPPGFEAFYAAYPKKVDPTGTAKAFGKVDPNPELLAVMLAAIERQKKTPGWVKDDGQFIPYPATWLNQRRWEDGAASIQSDPDRPAWALQAGFKTRFDAENAGCNERNAGQFQAGNRLENA